MPDESSLSDVWLQDADTGTWSRVKLIKLSGDTATVREWSGRGVREVDASLVCPCNDLAHVDVDNLIALPHLDEPNMLETLRVRYLHGDIYTRSGQVLIAVNPWRDIGVAGAAIMQRYLDVSVEGAPSHIYLTGRLAFDAMKLSGRPQSILVSGESGAGACPGALSPGGRTGGGLF